MKSLWVILATPGLLTLCQASSQLPMTSALRGLTQPAFCHLGLVSILASQEPWSSCSAPPLSFLVLTGVSPLCIQLKSPHHWITLQTPVQMPTGCTLFQAPPHHLSICVFDYLSPDAMATFFQVESAQCYFLPGMADISRSLLQPQMQPWKCDFPGFHMGPGWGQPVTPLRGPTPPKSEFSQGTCLN